MQITKIRTMTFVIRTHDIEDGLLLDVPGSETAEGTQIILYGDFHGGPNQLWSQISITNKGDENCFQIISSLDDNVCLGVAMNQNSPTLENAPVVLCDKESQTFHIEWIFETHGNYTLIRLKDYPHMVLTNNMDANIVVTSEVNGNTSHTNHAVYTSGSDLHLKLWYLDKDLTISDAKPATSCHLRYGPKLCLKSELYEKVMRRHGWTLRNTVRVKEVADCTYFCIVGWGPGGYSGIQQIDENHRVAIFSMWHDEHKIGSNVECISSGDGVKVELFGGEGTGMKSMKDFWWHVGEEITFTIQGNYNESSDAVNPGAWTCSCWYSRSSEEHSQLHFMSTYRRQGESCPLNDSGFYSFVEDWNRCSNAEGYLSRRCAVFTSPEIEYGGRCKILEGDNCDTESKSSKKCLQTVKLFDPSFTKVETGCDAFSKHTANAKIRNDKCKFTLETGGSPKYASC